MDIKYLTDIKNRPIGKISVNHHSGVCIMLIVLPLSFIAKTYLLDMVKKNTVDTSATIVINKSRKYL